MTEPDGLLPIGAVPGLTDLVNSRIDGWHDPYWQDAPYPRSFWLGQLEEVLASAFPRASRRQLNVTARWYAPFELRRPGTD